jgi:putative PEP-CTERM system histidine kinase
MILESAVSIQNLVTVLAILSSLSLAAVVHAPGGAARIRWGFVLGMLGFGAEGLATLMLATVTELPAEHLVWLRVALVAGLLLPIPWSIVVAGLCHPTNERLGAGWRVGVGIVTALGVGGSLGVLAGPSFELFDDPGRFHAARIGVVGHYATIIQLLATAGILGGLEACLRTSRGASRWRLKYLVLGIGGIFLVRFYLLSHILLFHVLMAVYLTTMTATQLVGNLMIGASLLRDRLLSSDLVVARHVVYRSIVVGVLGFYLFVIGGLGWLMTRLGVAEDLFWGSLIVFVSALGLATVLLSEDLRWRLKRFVGRNFYRSKYDYRYQWITFTERLGSLLTVDELVPQLLDAVTEAVGTAKAALYLLDERDGRYHLVAAREMNPPANALPADSSLMSRIEKIKGPVLLESGDAEAFGTDSSPVLELLAKVGVLVPLYWRGTLGGFMLIGYERTGAAYTREDVEFLSTVAEQAAGAIATARLSETLARSREFEAFHRLTSFVIHDLKNSISALSMLSDNALDNFDDPEFQRDAIKTLSQTVGRMKSLLSRLSSTPDAGATRWQIVDVAALAKEATAPIVGSARVRLVTNLDPVPPVRGDHDALLRVFQNLVSNAVEALEGSGTVTVATYQEGRAAVYAITDSGHGMSETFLRKSLFAPFQSTKQSGWGIGLYQAKGIVDAHGGSIEVSSKEGEGTTFRVRLPVQPPVGQDLIADSASPSERGATLASWRPRRQPGGVPEQ